MRLNLDFDEIRNFPNSNQIRSFLQNNDLTFFFHSFHSHFMIKFEKNDEQNQLHFQNKIKMSLNVLCQLFIKMLFIGYGENEYYDISFYWRLHICYIHKKYNLCITIPSLLKIFRSTVSFSFLYYFSPIIPVWMFNPILN